MQGSLKVKVMRGQINKDEQIFGKMDPYVQIIYQESSMQTKVAQNQGKTPEFGDIFSIRFNTGIQNNLIYKIMNSYGSQEEDVVLGFGTVLIDQLHQHSGKDIQLPLLENSKPAGHLIVNLSFILDNVNSNQVAQKKELEELKEKLFELEITKKGACNLQKLQQHLEQLTKTILDDQHEIKSILEDHQIKTEQLYKLKQEIEQIQDQKNKDRRENGECIEELNRIKDEFVREKEEGFNEEVIVKGLRLQLNSGSGEGCNLVLSVKGQSKTTEPISAENDGWPEEIQLEGKQITTLHFEILKDSFMYGSSLIAQATYPFIQFDKGQEQQSEQRVTLTYQNDDIGFLFFTLQ